MNVRKWHHSKILIAINDESQGSIAKNLRRDTTHLSLNLLVKDISQGSVATRLGCDGVFIHHFVANFLLSLTVKEFWKSVNIWWSYGQELGVLFFLTHSVVSAFVWLFSAPAFANWDAGDDLVEVLHVEGPWSVGSHILCAFRWHVSGVCDSLVWMVVPHDKKLVHHYS